MKEYYDRFGEPKEKYTKQDNSNYVIILFILLALFSALGVLSSCSNTAHVCPAYDVQGKYVQR